MSIVPFIAQEALDFANSILGSRQIKLDFLVGLKACQVVHVGQQVASNNLK